MRIPPHWKPYLWPVVLAIGIKLIWMFAILLTNPEHGFYMFDSELYWHFAQTMVDHGEMSYTNGETFVPVHSHTPGYPWLIAFFIWSGLFTKGLIFFQILCTVVTAVLVVKIGRLLFKDERVGTLAALLLAVDLPSIVFANMVMTETVYTTLFTLSFYCFLKVLYQEGSYKWMLLSGLLLGIAILCRPVGLFIPFLFLFWWLIKRKSFLKPWLAVGLFSIGIFLPVGGWMVRNYTVFDEVFITTLGHTNLYFYRAAGVVADQDGRALYEVHRSFKQEHPVLVDVDHPREYIAQSRFYRDEGLKIIGDNVGTYIKIHVYAAIKLLGQPMRQPIEMQFGYRNEEEAVTGWTHVREGNIVERVVNTTSGFTLTMVIFQFLHLGVLWVFILMGLIRLLKRKQWWPIFVLGGIVLYYCIVAAGPETDARFRIALMPFICLAGAFGWYAVRQKREATSNS